MKLCTRYLSILIFVFITLHAFSKDTRLSVTSIACEGKTAATGVDLQQIYFSWKLSSSIRSQLQTAYQLVVSSSADKLNAGVYDVWNSSMVKSNESIQVVYKGKKLKAGTRYYWRVKVWGLNKTVTDWSNADTFITGLFSDEDWSNAQWIGYENMPDAMKVVPGVHSPGVGSLGNKCLQRSIVPLFRKDFSVTKKIVQATVFITGLGQYEMSLNGQKVSDGFLAPGWTYYEKTCLYNVYDVTKQLAKGNNAIGVVVGNGFYNINRERYYKFVVAFGYPKMICKLNITYSDGSTQVIVSDNSWKVSPSPTTFSSIFGGEDYDATLEQKNWNRPGFNDAHWKDAIIVDAPKGKLVAESDYPLAVMDKIFAKQVTAVGNNSYLYDFAQNASGIIEFSIQGKKGDTVKLVPSELITIDKKPNQNASGAPYIFTYILKGGGIEKWRPQFTYYGFRYLTVYGAAPASAGRNDLPVISNVSFLHTRNSTPETGSFNSADLLFNRTDTLIKWAIKSNMQSVITDCPHREKLGWMEQDYLMGASIQFNYNIALLYKKIVKDMIDAQLASGLEPDIAPEFVVFDDGFRDSPEWGSAAVILPWLLYKWYGDKETMQQAYAMMGRYVAYLKTKSVNHILDHGLGDWYDYGPGFPGEAQLTPKSLTATAIYYYDVSLLSKMAALLGKGQDAENYKDWAFEIKNAFNKKFFNPATNVYSTGSQTAMAMPVCVGLVDEQDKKAVMQNLIDSIKQSKYKLTAGDIGFHFLIQALNDNGASSVIYTMNQREEEAGYGYQLKKGATALTESWNALEEVSNNHLMLGHIMEWFYNGLGGINQADTDIAYKSIIIDPQAVGDISFANAKFESPYGLIRSAWKKKANSFLLEVEIPVNTTAVIYLPANNIGAVKENGKPVAGNKQMKLAGFSNGKAMVSIGSGVYRFETQL